MINKDDVLPTIEKKEESAFVFLDEDFSGKVESEEGSQDKHTVQGALEALEKRSADMIQAEEEERKGDGEGCLLDPLALRWSKEALNIVTQHLSE